MGAQLYTAHGETQRRVASPCTVAISFACLLTAVPSAVPAQPLQKYYLPPPSMSQERQPVQQADPYARFRSFIQNQSKEEKDRLYKKYQSAYSQAESAGNGTEMRYYGNLMSILLQSGVTLNQ
jgi:hypothetical protein